MNREEQRRQAEKCKESKNLEFSKEIANNENRKNENRKEEKR